ncbi:MAG: NADH-quinone oxidoreductase subunit L [Polyangiaceae bacterium]
METGHSASSPALFSLFAANDFALLGLILLMPLVGAFVNGVFGKRLGKSAVRLMALTALGVSFLAACATFVTLFQYAHEHHGEHVKLAWSAWDWMYTTGNTAGYVPIDIRFSVDALSGIMMLVITGVGFLIHLYSSAYMENDPGYWRFFAYLNLFIFSMLTLVLGDNLPLLFVGWEGVGLCSYLLIGFWFEKGANAAAGKKAFIANRIGDFGLICGMFLIAHYTGALDWSGIEKNVGELTQTNPSSMIHVWPVGNGQYKDFFKFLQPEHPFTILPATAVGLALFLGCTGKSAQLPLYVWLPDAMAGPTPVSALIHAATMVTAGVYLVCRLSFLFVLSPAVMTTIAVTGAATALFAATIALVQNDIKKVLAYSTVSQLGFMFLGVGVGAFTDGFFHVFTHAFFKACLFLGSGSVIHAMHTRIHDDVASQDMRNMGGLKKFMPVTFWTFTLATLAIIGFPFLSGFFSKDEILFKAFVNHSTNPVAQALKAQGLSVYEPPMWLGKALYATGILAATLTAFYMCRALILTFFGEFRGWKVAEGVVAADDHHDHHDDHGEHPVLPTTPGAAPHESPWPMTLPLVVLASSRCSRAPSTWASSTSTRSGTGSSRCSRRRCARSPNFPTPTPRPAPSRPAESRSRSAPASRSDLRFPEGRRRSPWPNRRASLYRLVYDKWRIDELYDAVVVAAVESLAETFLRRRQVHRRRDPREGVRPARRGCRIHPPRLPERRGPLPTAPRWSSDSSASAGSSCSRGRT